MSFKSSIRDCLDWTAAYQSTEDPETEGSRMKDTISTFQTTRNTGQREQSWLRGLGEEEEEEEAVAARTARRNPHYPHPHPRRALAETST